MFTLLKITIGCYAVIKYKEKTDDKPLKVYGFIVITEIDNKFIGEVLQASKRLIKSGQIDILIEAAKDLTEKAEVDEFVYANN